MEKRKNTFDSRNAASERMLKNHGFDITRLQGRGGLYRNIGSHADLFVFEQSRRYLVLCRNRVSARHIGHSRWVDRRFGRTQGTLGYAGR
jgi:hypothetical protein